MEQKTSSNETAVIIDATPSKGSTDAEMEEYIVHLASVIQKHLTEIYQRLNQLEAKIEKCIAVRDQETDAAGRTKLSVQEFREFVDLLNETLIEALPKATVAAESSTSEALLKSDKMQGETATKQNVEPEQTQRRWRNLLGR